MKRPAPRAFFIGHPIVMGAVMLAGCAILYACWLGGTAMWIPALIAACIMGESARSNEEVAAYKKWKAAWDSFDGAPPPPSRFWTKLGMALGGLLMVGVLAASGKDVDDRTLVIGWIVGVLLMALLPWLIYALFRAIVRLLRVGSRGRRNRVQPVTVIARTIVRAPSLQQAFDSLPEHCRRILAPAAR